jgi:general nucleoside transport system ATP-binding protein
MTVTLELQDISKSFDGFRALDRASFAAESGKIHALLGENGAGKSTLMNICCGLYTPDAGVIKLFGASVSLSGPREAAACGVGMLHQHFKLVRPFTILENVLLATQRSSRKKSYRETSSVARNLIREAASLLGASVDPDCRVDALSVAEQQRVEVIKALVGGARILILDEPTAVLTDQEAERLLHTLRELAARGSTIVLVTHKLADVKRFADRVTIMRGGKIIRSVNPGEMSVAELTRLTVGDALPPIPQSGASIGRLGLETSTLSCRRSDGSVAFDSVSFHVKAGEIYGLAGVSGNGQSELAETLMGVRKPTSGTIRMGKAGETLREMRPSALRATGAAFIPADRYRYALAGGLSVLDNFAVCEVSRGRYGSWAWIRRRGMRSDAQQALKAFDVQGVHGLDQKAALLSGGNAQKLVLAREFANLPSVVIAQSPSRGLDARATAAVRKRLQESAAQGAAVLLISEDLDEVLELANRVGVMSAGRIVAEFEAPADRQAVGRAMVAHA